MKIVVSGYVGKKITGIGRNLICLLENVGTEDEYVIYANEDMKEAFEISKSNITVKTYKVSKNSSLGNLLWTTFVFPFKVLKEKADKALIPNFTLLLLKFKPTVVIMHDLIEFNVPNKFSKIKMFYRKKIADPITAKLADSIITVSKNSKKDIKKYLKVPGKKVTVIYNGVDRKKFHKIEKNKAIEVLDEKNWPHDYMLYVGTVDHPGKNAMGLIKSFEKIKKDDKYAGKLVLAGMPGAGYEVIENYVNGSAYKNDIVLTGFITDEQLVALYSMCKVFCFLSFYEGFGIPPLEALACGAKVIVANTSSLPEVVGNVGWTVDVNNDNDVVDTISTVLKEETMRDEAKVEEHLKKYNWKLLSEKFEEVLRKN